LIALLPDDSSAPWISRNKGYFLLLSKPGG
jgi:hypothetical protein